MIPLIKCVSGNQGAYPNEDVDHQLVGSNGEEANRPSLVKHGLRKEARPKRSRKPNPKYVGPD
jgi:hypothetical protein